MVTVHLRGMIVSLVAFCTFAEVFLARRRGLRWFCSWHVRASVVLRFLPRPRHPLPGAGLKDAAASRPAKGAVPTKERGNCEEEADRHVPMGVQVSERALIQGRRCSVGLWEVEHDGRQQAPRSPTDSVAAREPYCCVQGQQSN